MENEKKIIENGKEKKNNSNFLICYKAKKDEDGKVKFDLMDGGYKELPYIEIADSGYEQTFKQLFSWKHTINGISGEERLISLLNSLLYPNVSDDGYNIKKVTTIRNESNRLGSETKLGVPFFDVVCRCECWKGKKEMEEEIEIFDVEMQTGYDNVFISRAFEYGVSLRDTIYIEEKEEERRKKKDMEKSNIEEPKKKIKKHPVKVLSFINYDNKETDNIQYKSYKTEIVLTDLDGNKIKTMDDPPVEVYFIDLQAEIEKLSKSEEISINGKEISKTGKEWIKLLGLRHWATQINYYLYHRYVIPKDTSDSDEVIQSALKILQLVDEESLIEYCKAEMTALSMLETYESLGEKRGEKIGEKRGEKIGEKRKAYEICENLLLSGVDIDFIIKITKLQNEEIEEIRKKLKKSEEN